ncbi:tryptophan 7-halogenase [Actinomycetospora endophytica]|uniref:Tryptophan 7-halogenase n=1 Tax=Actinomycetospora endophytica TaxID=2291215 RepID=A0ABS8P1Q8_9PSEU|nr:tryptophan 7-halogenase [Actinomycetospora endophytica]MCD2192164.1 tryptophan 7-halogenase [Actinomycetospora endophytica]
MHVAIVGAGPTGLFLGAALAHRGHRVAAVDRDAGPGPDGGWERRGVMQFHHAHGFRPQIGEALQAEIPEAYDGWLAAGAEPITFTLPDGGRMPGGMRSRRETFERALRAAVVGTPGFTLRRGHVDAVTLDETGAATGLRVDGDDLPADLVIDASGRAGRATRALRAAPTLTGRTGIAYVDRQYRLRPGADPGPMTNPLAWQADLGGYQVIVFRHERGVFSVLVVRPTADPDLALLRHEAAFEAACRAVPGLDAWTDPDRSEPITPVFAGGALLNHYRGQAAPDGGVRRGFVAVGDAVATTTPMFGRGITTSLLQAREVLRLLDDGVDPSSVGEPFDAWCEAQMRPWVTDHVRMDAAMLDRWDGLDVDLTRRLPSDLVMAAAQVDPTIGRALPPYLAMLAGPECLDDVEPLAAAVYRSGWRPPRAEGPDRDELAATLRGALVAA